MRVPGAGCVPYLWRGGAFVRSAAWIRSAARVRVVTGAQAAFTALDEHLTEHGCTTLSCGVAQYRWLVWLAALREEKANTAPERPRRCATNPGRFSSRVCLRVGLFVVDGSVRPECNGCALDG